MDHRKLHLIPNWVIKVSVKEDASLLLIQCNYQRKTCTQCFRASLTAFGYKVETKQFPMHAGKRQAPLVQCSLSAAQCSSIVVVLPCSTAAPMHESCRWSVHELNWAWILLSFLAFNRLTNSENIAAGESQAYAAYSVFLCVAFASVGMAPWLPVRLLESWVLLSIYIVFLCECSGYGALTAAYCVFFLLFCVLFVSLILYCTFQLTQQ